MIQSIYQMNACKFWISSIPVVIVGVMAPLRSYIMQLLIDSKSYRDLLKKCLIAAVFSIVVFIFEWISKKRQAVVVRDMEKDLRDQVMCKLFYISANYLFCVEPFILLIVAVVSIVQFRVPNILKAFHWQRHLCWLSMS